MLAMTSIFANIAYNPYLCLQQNSGGSSSIFSSNIKIIRISQATDCQRIGQVIIGIIYFCNKNYRTLSQF